MGIRFKLVHVLRACRHSVVLSPTGIMQRSALGIIGGAPLIPSVSTCDQGIARTE